MLVDTHWKKRLGYILLAAVAVSIGCGYILFNPVTAVANTLQTAVVIHIALHLAEGSNTILIYHVALSNPSRIPVTVDSDEITLLVNGTDYASIAIQSEPVTVGPGVTFTLQRLVRLTGSPIGYQSPGPKRYILEAIVKFSASADSLGMSASRSRTFTDERSWTFFKAGP